jgi:hypothetical protein
MKIAHVPNGSVIGLIPALLPFLNNSQEWGYGRANADDIIRLVLSDRLSLWAVNDKEE